MNRILILLLLATFLTGCGGGDANSDAETSVAEVADDAGILTVHELNLPGLDGATINLGDFKGDVILVDFWATWCGPCRQVMPALQEIHDELGAEGVRIIALSTDRQGAEVVAPFISQNGYTFPVALMNQDAFRVFGQVNSIPTTFVIKGDGSISETLVGAHPKSDYLAAIERARS